MRTDNSSGSERASIAFKTIDLRPSQSRSDFLATRISLSIKIGLFGQSVCDVELLQIRLETFAPRPRGPKGCCSWLILEVGEGKTRKARQFPVGMIPRLKAAIDDQLERVAAMERLMGKVIPWLFVGETGKRIKSFRTAWLNARIKAGVPKATPHDFRRVAVRALNAAGVPIRTAMEMVGHKTMSVYHRYGIVDEKDLIAGGELAAYYEKRETN